METDLPSPNQGIKTTIQSKKEDDILVIILQRMLYKIKKITDNFKHHCNRDCYRISFLPTTIFITASIFPSLNNKVFFN